MNGLLLNVIYGGRIDNNFDLRILRSYLEQYFNDDLLGKERSAVNEEISVPLSKNLRVFFILEISNPYMSMINPILGLRGTGTPLTGNG